MLGWANKAEALASYAKQADDDTLRKQADRIQARAIRRCGELLKQFDGRGRPTENNEGAHTISQREAAAEAGMSRHQQSTAVRVANLPAEAFVAELECRTVGLHLGEPIGAAVEPLPVAR